jgi:N-methylhydantoinase A
MSRLILRTLLCFSLWANDFAPYYEYQQGEEPDELDDRAERFFTDANFPRDKIIAKYQVNMRYRGQNWALTFDMHSTKGRRDLSFIDRSFGRKAIELFNKRHMEEYGHVREGETPEIVGVRLATTAETPSPKVVAGLSAPAVPAKTVKTRLANLGRGYKETAVFRGSDLKPGHEVTGPAIVEEAFTTIVVYPDWKARVDDAGDYELTKVA